VFLGSRVPIELRVFLTAAVIIDDIMVIVIIALFYSGEITTVYLVLGIAVVALLIVLNRIGVYTALPYAVCGIVRWFFLHEAGLHATLAGVILAVLIPTRPPANLALELARLNVAFFPNSFNIYDTYGEILAATGKRDLAILMYKRSLTLNPNNEGGKRALERLVKLP
jgi:Na+/H+ antiporter NhaA